MVRRNTSFDPAFIKTASPAMDIDEVSYMRLYEKKQLEDMPSHNATHSGHTIHDRPLIDIVNPQPKAFFAYLQMPKKTTSTRATKKSSARIKRTRKKEQN